MLVQLYYVLRVSTDVRKRDDEPAASLDCFDLLIKMYVQMDLEDWNTLETNNPSNSRNVYFSATVKYCGKAPKEVTQVSTTDARSNTASVRSIQLIDYGVVAPSFDHASAQADSCVLLL